TFLFSIACLASLGLPALAGFVAEYLVFTGTFAILPVVTILSVFGVVLTAGYLLWMLRRAFYGPRNRLWVRVTETPCSGAAPLIALTVVIVLVGIFPRPIIDLISPSLQQILGTVQALAAR